jgi:hypothetical protein
MRTTIFPTDYDNPTDPSLCFVVMPFTRKLKNVYDMIHSVVTDYAGFNCIRADDIAGSNAITDDIWKSIRTARFLIAEITAQNANVYYELGVGHALSKPVILLLGESKRSPPFDISHIRYLRYSSDYKILRKELIKYIKASITSIPPHWNKELVSGRPEVRITNLEAPSKEVVGRPIRITLTAKNFGAFAKEGYLAVSFPGGVSEVTIIDSDIPTKRGKQGDAWKGRQVILSYPIAEAYIYTPDKPTGWPTMIAHRLTVEVTAARHGLLQYYVSCSSKVDNGPFIYDPQRTAALLDQRDEPVYCGVVDVQP